METLAEALPSEITRERVALDEAHITRKAA